MERFPLGARRLFKNRFHVTKVPEFVRNGEASRLDLC
jgi:hypothetical protein